MLNYVLFCWVFELENMWFISFLMFIINKFGCIGVIVLG